MGKPAACVSQQCWAQAFTTVLTVEANNTFFVLNNSAKLIEHLGCTGQGRILLWVNDSVFNPWALLTGFAHAQFPLPVLNSF